MVAMATLVWIGVAQAQEPSALTCADFRPTEAAKERFPDLIGACEAVVERNGELYGKFTAIVRRASSRSVTLFIPAVDRTFSIEPQPDARVEIGGRKYRPRELTRGQEIRIYLAASEFAEPDIDEVAFVTEEELIIEHTVMPIEALPTTASLWPTVGLGSLMLIGIAASIRGGRAAIRGGRAALRKG
jgi:hypothetical protein